MKIALVVHDFSPTFGHGRYSYELARRFAGEHEVHIFANRVDERARIGGVTFHHVPAVRANALSTVLTFPLPATLRIGHGFNIVHAQGVTCLRFNVITGHVSNAGWARAQANAQVARTWRQRVFESLVTPIEAAVFRHSRHAKVIAISHQLKRELADYYHRTDDVEVIYHGVDVDLFSPEQRLAHRASVRQSLGVHDARVLALFVGDLRKGAETVLAVIARTPGLHVAFVSGSDPAPYAERATALGIANRVIFQPATTHVERYFAAADLFLFPTPYDAFGMVVAEAMASGLPVVTSRQAGASELIDHGVSGFLVDRASDNAGFAEYAERLMRDGPLRTAMGAAARVAILPYTWDEVARRTIAVYERALEDR